MRLIDGREHFRCEHCETFRFAAPLADSIDRVVLLGESGEHACPACETPLTHAALDGAKVLCCEACRGLLVESEVFAHVNRRRRAEYDRADVTPRRVPVAEADIHAVLDQIERVDLLRSHAAWMPVDVVAAQAAKRPKTRRQPGPGKGTGGGPGGTEASSPDPSTPTLRTKP